MIQTDESKDRGQELYRMFGKAITNLVISRKQQYFDSANFKGLQNRCKLMDQYIDNSAPPISTFVSDITPQTIRKAYVEYSALFKKFLETDPLFSIDKISQIPKEQEHAIIEAINNNLKKTYFRERCLCWNIDDMVRYGTSATYSFATNDYNANSLMTVKSGDGYEGTYDQVYSKGESVVLSTPIHPLNVIMDPRSNFMVSPDYQGFIGDICVSSIKMLADNPAYIAENIQSVFKQCVKGMPDEHWFDGQSREARNFTRGQSNITYLWTRLPFEGNEDDPYWYAIEIIDKEIIRIEENPLDSNTIPLAIQRIMPRKYTWYGNSPLEDKICIQNLQYWLSNTTVESTARLMDRIILYKKGSLDVEGINARHQTGGLVPYEGQEQDLSKLLYSPQFPNNAYRENDWLTQFMRREDQDSSAMPNFNPQAEGGPTNKTLGGAQMMASIGEIKMGLIVDQLATGLKDVAKHQFALLKNITTGAKDFLLGNVQFSCKISNVFNYVRESVDSQNRLSQLINFKATQLPQFKAIRTGSMVKDWLRNSLKSESIEDYCDIQAIDMLDEQDIKSAIVPPAQTMGPGGVPGMPPQVQPPATPPQGGIL
jgi:hypothetical protein